MGDKTNLYESFMMISDWSGAAFDFSFTQKRRVLFIDTPQKINNPNFSDINLPAAEREIRDKIGRVISIDQLGDIDNYIKGFFENNDDWNKRISNIDNKFIYNLGNSAKVIASELIKI